MGAGLGLLKQSRPSWLPGAATLAWALIGAAACSVMIPLEPNLLEEGLIVHVAQRLLRGERLYRDIASFTGPFPFELLAVSFRLFGEEILVARSVVVALHGVACAAAYGMARRAKAGPLAHAAAGCVASAPVLLFPLYSIFFYSTLAFHLSLIAGYAAVRGMGSARWGVSAGVLVACVALSKQSVGAVLAMGLIVSLALGSRPGERIRRMSAMISGAVAVAVITLAGFALHGDLGALVRSLVVLPFSLGETFRTPYMNLWPPGEFSAAIRPHQGLYLPQLYSFVRGFAFADVGKPMALATQLLYALPFLALLATGVRRVLGTLPAAIWVHTAVLVALSMNLFPRPDWGHLVFVLPSSLVQLLLLMPGSRGTRFKPWAAGVLVLAFGVCSGLVGTLLHGLAGPASFGPRIPQRPVSALYRIPAVPHVIRYLRDRVRPDEPIFVARAEPLIYFATGTRNPTPFSGVIPGLRDEQESAILAGLEDVRYVVMSDLDQPAFMYYRDELPAVQAYLERYFHVPEAFSGRDASWILVLERGRDRGKTAIDLLRSRESARAWIRGRTGVALPAPESPPRLATRQNRRPLALVLGTWGGGIDFEIDLPRRAVFQASVGLRSMTGISDIYTHPPRTRLVVSIKRGERFETLATVRVLEYAKQGLSWSPLEVDLSAYGGNRVTLRLESSPESPLAPGALAWWGSPRIALRPARSID